MRTSTLPRYLIGRRDAIVQVASSPMAIVCGVLFVISAGLAREYDGEDLLHEPWHVLRPLAASFVSGTTLFILIHVAALFRSGRSEQRAPGLPTAYRSFMGLFWMTAPLAWLYAIPYERMMTPVGAIEMNLWTLALVSTWRVVLITRVISVVYGIHPARAFFLVMLFADAVVLVLVSMVPVPIIDLMGGIRHTERDALIAGITFSTGFYAVLSAPVWIIGALVSVGTMRPNWANIIASRSMAGSRGLLVAAIVSIVMWIPVLFFTQPEQINARRAERLLREGRIAEAFVVISAKRQGDYPPHWNPPPRLGYRERTPDLDAVMQAMRVERPADWLAEIYLDKIRRRLKQNLFRYWREDDWADIVSHLEESGQLEDKARDHADAVTFLLEFDPTLSPDDRASLERLEQAGANGGVDPSNETDH